MADEKAAKAVRHDLFLPRLQLMLAADRLRGLSYNFMFENPRGNLQCRPYMQIAAWPKIVEVVKRTVHLCAWGHPFRKATQLWTGLLDWSPTGSTGNGRCGRQCGQGGPTPTGGWQHFQRMGGQYNDGPTGKGRLAARNALPKELVTEVLQVALKEANPAQRIVIDLCAGFGSLRQPVLAEGLTYVAVDIRNRRTLPRMLEET